MSNIKINFQNSAITKNVGAVRALGSRDKDIAITLGYYEPGDGGGGIYFADVDDTTSPDTGGTVLVALDGTRWKWSGQETLRDRHFGAIGDGYTHPASDFFAQLSDAQAVYPSCLALTDEIDTLAYESLIFMAIEFKGTAGVFRMCRGLNWQHGTRYDGAGRWSATASTFETTSTTTLLYTGPGGTDSYVVKISDAAFGTQATNAATRDMQNVRATNFNIDGGDLAEYGLAEQRAWAGNNLDNITITNTRVCGNWVTSSWVRGPRGRHFFKNRGAGFWLGKNIKGWAQSTTVDEAAMIDWFSYFAGCDQSGNPFSVFADNGDATAPTSSNPDVECGGGIYGSRSLAPTNLKVQNCSGPGLYLELGLFPVLFSGGYNEHNGRSVNASKPWAEWINSTSSTKGVKFDTIYYSSTLTGNPPAHRLTGIGTSAPEEGIVWENCIPMGDVYADTGIYYNRINCDRATNVFGQKPSAPHLSEGGYATKAGNTTIAVIDRGSFSPAMAGTTIPGTGWAYASSNNLIEWYRFGQILFYTGRVALSAVSADATGNMMITGFPYPASTGQAYQSSSAIANETVLATPVVSMTGYIDQGSSHILLFKRTAAAVSEAPMVLGDIAPTTSFRVGGLYFIPDGQ